MADVRRPSAAAAGAHPIATFRGWTAVTLLLFRQLEAQRARHGIGFGNPQLQLLALAVRGAGVLADQLLGFLVIAEIFVADRRDRNEAVAAKLDHRREKAERLHASDPAHDELPDLVGEVSGDVAVDRLP